MPGPFDIPLDFPFGEPPGPPPPTPQPSLQFRIKNKLQLCEAIQITITELGPIPTDVAVSLDAVDLEVGSKVGGFKGLGPNRTIG